jgi:thymidylate kinase
VIYLDAPAEVLFERKGEGTLERIERMQEGYWQFGAQLERFVCVDATQPQDDVLREVADIIHGMYAEGSWVPLHQDAKTLC